MTIYRFARENYGINLSGEGARLKGGRWNQKGIPAVYTSTTISLSLLELLIHSISFDELNTNILMQVYIPPAVAARVKEISPRDGWQQDMEYTRYIGSAFLQSKSAPALRVPSAIIPQEYNLLLNPLHPDMRKISIISAAPFAFDSRLFK